MHSDSNTSGQARIDWFVFGTIVILVLLFMFHVLFPTDGYALAGNDVRGQYWPWMTFFRETVRSGQLPLWDSHQFSGFPIFSDPQVGFFYPPAWLALLIPVNVAISWYVAFHLMLAGIGMFLLMRRLRANELGAMLAALTFTFSGYFCARLEVGSIGLVATMAWVPWVLLAYDWSVERSDIWSGILSGVPVGLAILSGNTPSLLYLSLIWLGYLIYLGLAHGRWIPLLRQTIIGGLTGVLLSGIQLLPLFQFISHSTRSGGTLAEWGTLWSFPPFHLITLVIPGYFGDPIQTGYWSVPDFAELTYYIGILPLLVFPLTISKPTRLTWLYIGLILFGLLAALGTYGFLYPILYSLLLPFRLVRGPARAAFLFVFASSALLGETLSVWERAPLHERVVTLRAIMRWMLPVIAVIGILGLAATGAVFVVFHPSETGGRLWHQASGWTWALALALAGSVLMWRYLTADPEQSMQRRVLGIGLGALVVVDLWSFGFKLIELQPAAVAPMWTDAKAAVGETSQRVAPWAAGLYIQNDLELIGMSSVLSYNPLEIAAYHDLAIGIGDPRSTAYDILGVEYVVSPNPLEAAFTEGERPVQLVASTHSAWIYRRTRVIPIARLVYRAEIIANPAEARARLHEPSFDPTTTVLLDTDPSCQISPEPEGIGTAQIVEQRSGYWLIETQSQAPALHVLSETAYPGWRVSIDGKAAQPLTAYTTLRAVCVPAGKHEIEWVFDPIINKVGAAVTVSTIMICGLAGTKVRHSVRPAIPLPDQTEEDDE